MRVRGSVIPHMTDHLAHERQCVSAGSCARRVYPANERSLFIFQKYFSRKSENGLLVPWQLMQCGLVVYLGQDEALSWPKEEGSVPLVV